MGFDLDILEFRKIREALLKHCLTPMAEETVSSMEPMRELSGISDALDETSEMKDILQFDDAFPIDTLKDVRALLQKIKSEGTFLNPEHLWETRLFLETTRRIRAYFKARMEKYPKLWPYAERLLNYPEIENAIEHEIDESGVVKDTASPKLRALRRERETKSSHLRRKMELLAREYASAGYASDAIVSIRDGRMVIPVRDEYKNAVRGFIHDESASGQTVFIEPAEGLELNNELRKLILEENREVERIL